MLQQLLSVFLESKCPLCQKTTPQTVCRYCFNKLSSHQLSLTHTHNWCGDLPVFAWGKYDGQLKRAISLMKYSDRPEIGIFLGQLLAKAWLDRNFVKGKNISVIPIPLHSEKLKDRGFNQAEKIARGFCQLTQYSLSSQTLIRVKNTRPMFELNSEERVKNLQGAFSIGQQLPKYPVLLLDDIYTMGTTIKESARILRQHKIKVIGSVVIAKTGSN